MQQPVPSGDVFKPSASVVVDGVVVDVSSVQVDRELPDALAGGGFAAASSVFVGAAGEDVSSRVPTPWGGLSWPPVPEASARIGLNVGPGEVQSLTGRVQEVSGGSDGRAVTVDVADLYQTLDRSISWGPLSDAMPDDVEGVAPRYVGLHSASVTDQILRHCGWYATPPKVGYTTFSVPAMGTMWPEVGELVSSNSYQHPDGGVYPFFNTSSWGLGVNRVDAHYSFASYTLNTRPHMEMTVLMDDIVGVPDRTTMSYRVETAGGQYMSIAWTPSVVNVWASGPGGAAVLAGQGTYAAGKLVYVKVDRVSASSITVQTLIGGTVVDTRTVTVDGGLISRGLDRARIRGDMMGGGFQLAYPGSTAHSLNGWSSSAVIHPPSTSHMLKFRPTVAGENCADLLQEQCEAQAATFWIDEHGVLQWWDLRALEARGDEFSVNAHDHVTEDGFSWSHSLSSVKSRVVVKWTDYSIRHSLWSKIPFWQDSGETMANGERIEGFINTPDDEVWLQPDLKFTRVGDFGGPGGATIGDFNRGLRSWWGGVVRDTEGWAYVGGNGFLSFSIQQINGVAFKYALERSGATDAELRTPSAAASTAVSRGKRSYDLPILRGKMKYTLLDAEYTAAQTGPPTAPEHVIEGGWWVQEEAQAKRIADYAAARVCVSHPELSAVSLVMIPGVQLGDIVTITDDTVTRLTIRGLVVGDSRSLDDSMNAQHSIRVRPLSVTRNGVTWEEWGDFMAGATFQAWGASQSGDTWTQWAANPLET